MAGHPLAGLLQGIPSQTSCDAADLPLRTCLQRCSTGSEPRSVRRVLKRTVQNGVAPRCELLAYGAFTVGAVADRGKTTLELDLALVESFPEEFRTH